MLNSEQENILYYIEKEIKNLNEKEISVHFSREHSDLSIYNISDKYNKIKNIINKMLKNIKSKYDRIYDDINIKKLKNKKGNILYCKEYWNNLTVYFQDIVKIDDFIIFNVNRREREFYIVDNKNNVYSSASFNAREQYIRFIENNKNNIISEMLKKELEKKDFYIYDLNKKIYDLFFYDL